MDCTKWDVKRSVNYNIQWSTDYIQNLKKTLPRVNLGFKVGWTGYPEGNAMMDNGWCEDELGRFIGFRDGIGFFQRYTDSDYLMYMLPGSCWQELTEVTAQRLVVN